MALEKTKGKNKVELLGYYGGDETHACSAWTSTNRNLDETKRDRIPELLTFLAENNHGTPFEKSSLHFLVNTDIASHIHIIKHRVGVSVNAESARYKELKEDKSYIPEDLFEVPIDENHGEAPGYKTWADRLLDFQYESNRLYHACLKDCTEILGRKRAKEVSRYFKCYSSQIQADVMFNFRSFVLFQNLRNKPEAQVEIQEIAAEMLRLVKNIPGNPFKYSLEAFKL